MSLNKEALIDFISSEFGLVDFGDELPLFSSGLLDSTCMITLVMFLEEQTGIMLQEDDLTLENFDSVRSMLSFCSTVVQ